MTMLFLFACAGGKPGGDDSAARCTVDLDGTVPGDGEAYWRADLEFQLSDPDPTSTITTDIPGELGFSDDDETVYWHLGAPLAPATAYTAGLTWCQGEHVLDFTTSALGEPLAADIRGATFALDVSAARFVSPPNTGTQLSERFDQLVLLTVTAADDGRIAMLGGIAAEGSAPSTQDFCSSTFEFPSADFSSSPYVEVSTETLEITVAGYRVAIYGASLSGTFSADGQTLGGAVLTGLVDTRGLGGGDTGEAIADVCALAENLGGHCVACPTDGEPLCLALHADQMTGQRVADLALAPVAAANCAGCAEGAPACDG